MCDTSGGDAQHSALLAASARHLDSSQGMCDHTCDCWMDWKAGGFMKSDRDCVLQNGRKQEPDAGT